MSTFIALVAGFVLGLLWPVARWAIKQYVIDRRYRRLRRLGAV